MFIVIGELTTAGMYRICKKAEAERVGESSAKEMAEVLEDIGIKIGEAIDFAVHAGRKTVKAEDVRWLQEEF